MNVEQFIFKALPRVPLYRTLAPRQFQLFCIGMAKSGTHSLASIFRPQFRASHEVNAEETIGMILRKAKSEVDASTLKAWLTRRDKRTWLEVDSSQLNYFFLSELIDLRPQARFVLTIRHPLSWLDSLINHQLAREAPSARWQSLRDLRFGANATGDVSAEKILAENNLYTLDGYFSYWAEHNARVLDLVPTERLLVVRTDQISESLEPLANFVGIDKNLLNRSQTHSYKAKAKLRIVDQIDSDYLNEKLQAHCQPLLDRYFPASA